MDIHVFRYAVCSISRTVFPQSLHLIGQHRKIWAITYSILLRMMGNLFFLSESSESFPRKSKLHIDSPDTLWLLGFLQLSLHPYTHKLDYSRNSHLLVSFSVMPIRQSFTWDKTDHKERIVQVGIVIKQEPKLHPIRTSFASTVTNMVNALEKQIPQSHAFESPWPEDESWTRQAQFPRQA